MPFCLNVLVSIVKLFVWTFEHLWYINEILERNIHGSIGFGVRISYGKMTRLPRQHLSNSLCLYKNTMSMVILFLNVVSLFLAEVFSWGKVHFWAWCKISLSDYISYSRSCCCFLRVCCKKTDWWILWWWGNRSYGCIYCFHTLCKSYLVLGSLKLGWDSYVLIDFE